MRFLGPWKQNANLFAFPWNCHLFIFQSEFLKNSDDMRVVNEQNFLQEFRFENQVASSKTNYLWIVWFWDFYQIKRNNLIRSPIFVSTTFKIKLFPMIMLILVNIAHCLGMSYYVNFLGGLGSNEFHIKLRVGTHGSWKNQNPGGHFGATS